MTVLPVTVGGAVRCGMVCVAASHAFLTSTDISGVDGISVH